MKLANVLREDNALLTFRDITPEQKAILTKIAAGKFDIETASPQAQAIFDELANRGLVDDMTHELTATGQRAAQIAARIGTTDLRQAARRDAKLGRSGGFQRDGATDPDLDGSEVVGSDLGRDRWEDVNAKHFD